MSESENPKRSNRRHEVTLDDVRVISGAATPHFALHIRNRLQRLIAPLPADHPARRLALEEIDRLQRLAVEGETRGHRLEDDERVSG